MVFLLLLAPFGERPRVILRGAMRPAAIVGGVGFVLGFVGPMLVTPEANQGPWLRDSAAAPFPRRAQRCALCVALLLPLASASAQQLAYPAAPRASVADDYFGHRVADPYRPLEDLDAPATKAWVDAEN